MIGALPLSRPRVAWRWYPLAVGAVLVAGALLRLVGLSAHYLSYDETFTALTAQLSLPNLIAATAGDVHPPAAYLLTWLVARVAGVSALTLRLPGALLSCLSLWQVWRLARLVKLPPAAELAGLALYALNPFLIHYAQDARMYPLLQLAVLGALLAAWQRQYARMALWLTLAVWTHNYGLFYLAVIGLLALAHEWARPALAAAEDGFPWTGPEDSSRLWHAAAALAVPVALWLPWLNVLRSQMQTVATGYWLAPLSLGQAIYPFYTLAWGVAMPAQLAGPAALVSYALLAFAAWKSIRLREYRVLLYLVAAPFVVAAAVSLLWKPVYLFRGFIGVAGPLALLLGWAMTTKASTRAVAWAGAMLAPLLLLAIVNRPAALATATGENSRAVEVVRAGWQAGDIVLHGNVGTLSGFLVAAPELPNFLMPVQPGSVGVLTPQTRRALGMCEGALTTPVLRADCGAYEAVQPWRRAWLVWGASQTISGVEDAAVYALLDQYPNQKILDIHDVYHGPLPVDGGIWLLTQP